MSDKKLFWPVTFALGTSRQKDVFNIILRVFLREWTWFGLILIICFFLYLLLKCNGYDLTMCTHKKAVDYIKKYPVLNMLVARKGVTHSWAQQFGRVWTTRTIISALYRYLNMIYWVGGKKTSRFSKIEFYVDSARFHPPYCWRLSSFSNQFMLFLSVTSLPICATKFKEESQYNVGSCRASAKVPSRYCFSFCRMNDVVVFLLLLFLSKRTNPTQYFADWLEPIVELVIFLLSVKLLSNLISIKIQDEKKKIK